MSGGEGPERRRRRTRTLLKATLAVLAVPVLLELGLRVALLARGEAYSAAGARAEIERLLTANRDFVPDPRQELGIEAALPSYAAEVPHLHPFLGFEAAGEKEYLEDELAGFAAAEAQGRYVVLILGGSVAQIFGQYGTAALARQETRGGHFRKDHPERDDANFLGNFIVRKDGETCAAELRPVPGRDTIAPPPPGEPDTGFDPVEAENAA